MKEKIHDCNLCDASRHEKRFRCFGFLRKLSSVMIHTYRCYCINTGWMTDDDRSREVEGRREQENTKAGVVNIQVEWLNNNNTMPCSDN